jgi:diacylglycerol kinase-like protein
MQHSTSGPACVLLLVNRASGTGNDDRRARRLGDEIAARLRTPVAIQLVDDHPAAASAVACFVASASRAVVIVGGGGGTLRAAVEGAWRTLGPDAMGRVVFAALRLGSGNVIAAALDVPADPFRALSPLFEALEAGRTVAIPLVRFTTPGGGERLALAMAGFGQWGRVPGDIARWRPLARRPRRLLARRTGIEALNRIEYRLGFALRLLQAIVDPGCLRCVELAAGSRVARGRLLAAGVLNLSVDGLPGPSLEEPCVHLYALPWPGRLTALGWLVGRGRRPIRPYLFASAVLGGAPIRIRADPGECFLDEDPELAGDLDMDVPATASFLPGGDLS